MSRTKTIVLTKADAGIYDRVTMEFESSASLGETGFMDAEELLQLVAYNLPDVTMEQLIVKYIIRFGFKFDVNSKEKIIRELGGK